MLLLAVASPAFAAADWYNFAIHEDQLSALVDVSNLNHRLEASDKVFVKNGHFYTVGSDLQRNSSDDKRLRFFGINLAATANFPTPEFARVLAQRLRSLGFNAVRLHQLDNYPGDQQDQPRSVLSSGAFPSFNEAALQRLRGLIHALSEQGLYVNLNLHVGYRFRPATDQVANLPNGQEMPYASHPYHLFDARMQTLQVDYARQLLRRLELRDEVGLAMVEINNESSLIGAWQRGQLDHLEGDYQRSLQSLWHKWLTRRYGGLQQACQYWQSCDMPRQGGLFVKSGEALTLERGTGWSARLYNWGRRIWQKLDWPLPSWLSQRFKLPEQGLPRRVYDYAQFLIETDQAYFNQIAKVVRAEVGESVAITGTQMYFGGIANFDSQQGLDYIDEHFYVDHYDFPGKAWDSLDWRIRNHSVTQQAWRSLLKRGWYRNLAKPFVISEYNQPFPNAHAAEIMPALSAVAAAQDWDGLFFYHYIDGDTWLSSPSGFSLSGHVGQLAGVGIAASLFRQARITSNSELLSVPLDRNLRTLLAALGDESRGFGLAEYISQAHGYQDQQLFLNRLGNFNSADLAQTRIKAVPQNSEQADAMTTAVWQRADQQLSYHTRESALRVQAEFLQMYLGGSASQQQARNQNFMPYFSKSGVERASLLLASRDALPLNRSGKILAVLVAATTGSQGNLQPAQPKLLQNYPNSLSWWTLQTDPQQNDKPSGSWTAYAPIWQQRIAAEFLLPSQKQSLKIYPLDGSGKRLSTLPLRELRRQAQGFLIELDYPSPWFELVLE